MEDTVAICMVVIVAFFNIAAAFMAPSPAAAGWFLTAILFFIFAGVLCVVKARSDDH